MMSNIPLARAYLQCALDTMDPSVAKAWVAEALVQMTRKPAIRKARKVGAAFFNDWQKEEIFRLAKAYPDMTMHQIADRTGVRSSGRVSEVLNGLR